MKIYSDPDTKFLIFILSLSNGFKSEMSIVICYFSFL